MKREDVIKEWEDLSLTIDKTADNIMKLHNKDLRNNDWFWFKTLIFISIIVAGYYYGNIKPSNDARFNDFREQTTAYVVKFKDSLQHYVDTANGVHVKVKFDTIIHIKKVK